MNYAAEGQEEIQSALWSRASIVLFTAAVLLNTELKYILLTSDFKSKEKNSIFTYIQYIYTFFGNTHDSSIMEVIWSDGPSSEFKNQYMVTVLKFFAKKYDKVFQWKYFATSHGKGLCDALVLKSNFEY